MFNVGPTELMVILVLALIVFGPKKLPEMGRSIGKGLREFRSAQADIKREIREGLSEAPTRETSPQPGTSSAPPGGSETGIPVSDGQAPSAPTST
jgi:sec-independent protein translocase protein TatA